MLKFILKQPDPFCGSVQENESLRTQLEALKTRDPRVTWEAMAGAWGPWGPWLETTINEPPIIWKDVFFNVFLVRRYLVYIF